MASSVRSAECRIARGTSSPCPRPFRMRRKDGPRSLPLSVELPKRRRGRAGDILSGLTPSFILCFFLRLFFLPSLSCRPRPAGSPPPAATAAIPLSILPRFPAACCRTPERAARACHSVRIRTKTLRRKAFLYYNRISPSLAMCQKCQNR